VPFANSPLPPSTKQQVPLSPPWAEEQDPGGHSNYERGVRTWHRCQRPSAPPLKSGLVGQRFILEDSDRVTFEEEKHPLSPFCETPSEV